jgi:endonuclease/exonuclease/phosphatase (EEP) superfamily protein YafD
VARIDYIWASPEWLPLDARVGKDAGSDHLPVIAALALRPAS